MNGESIEYLGFSSKSRINRCSDYPGAPLSFGLVVELILGNNPKEKSPMTDVSMRHMLEAGVHFGHQTRYWCPRMSPYIFGSRNKIHIIRFVFRFIAISKY